MTVLNTLARAAGLGLCVAAFSGTALADPGNGNGNGPATTPPGQEKKAEQAPPPAAAPGPVSAVVPQAQGQEHKAANAGKKAERKAAPKPTGKSEHKPAAKAAPKVAAKAEHKPAAKQSAKSAKSSGSYKETSSGTDLKKGMSHKHTICHATGSESNPYVVITPSVSGVFNGHIGHQGDEDIVPPFVYKGTTYSQNWDAEGQALFANGCAAPAQAPAPAKTAEQKTEEKDACPAGTRTGQVLAGIWHATGAYKDGQRKYVLISPSAKSAHWTKHEDDIPVYETRTVSTKAPAESCTSVAVAAQTPPAQTPPATPQPVTPVAKGTKPKPGTVGVLPAAAKKKVPTAATAEAGGVLGAVTPAKSTKQDEPAGGVLGAVASAPAAIASTVTSGTLPFTGMPLWIVALLGGGLLAAGIAMRRSA